MHSASPRSKVSNTYGLPFPASSSTQFVDVAPLVLPKFGRGEVAPRWQSQSPLRSKWQSHWQSRLQSQLSSESNLDLDLDLDLDLQLQSQSQSQSGKRPQSGQATVEFALVLVALVSVVWALLTLCLVVRDQVLVTHASREAARTYAVTRSVDAATQAARDRSGLGNKLEVTVQPQPDNLARLTVSLGIASRIPLVGRIRPGLQLQSSLITYVEPA